MGTIEIPLQDSASVDISIQDVGEDINLTIDDSTPISVSIEDNGNDITVEIEESTPISVSVEDDGDSIDVSMQESGNDINITFQEAISIWAIDSVTGDAFLNLGGTKVAFIDTNGNFFIKGRILKF